MSPFPVTLAVPPKRWHVFRHYSLFGPPEYPAQVAFLGGTGGQTTIELPDELFQRIEEIDLVDLHAIHEFVSQFGFMNVSRQAFMGVVELKDEDGGRLLRFLPIEVDLLSTEARPPSAIDRAGRYAGGPEALEMEWRRLASEANSPDEPMPEFFRTGGPDSGTESVDDFRLGASMIRLARLIVSELQHGKSFSLARITSAWPAYCFWPKPSNKAEASKMLEQLLSIGLAHQGIAIKLNRAKPESGTALTVSLETDLRESLFARIMLEFMQAIAHRHAIRQCARCGRWFSHMEGDSRYRQPRRDAKYCTPSCRSSATSAAYRRRQSL